MPRIRIKICGITRPEDARLAAEAGADAIGMIFHAPSRRNITTQQATHIIAQLGPFITPVGVFVDASVQTILGIATEIGLRTIQLHGHESPAQVLELGQHGLKILKAIRVDPSLPRELEHWRQPIPNLIGLVLETAALLPGGTGLANDWPAILHHQQSGLFTGLPPLIAAGGLDPSTVGQVIQSLHPFAVDVSSGVEHIVGQKSSDLVHAFIRAVRKAE